MVTFFAEVFEKILYNHTSKFLDRNGSIHENQFGFCKGGWWVGGGRGSKVVSLFKYRVRSNNSNQ